VGRGSVVGRRTMLEAGRSRVRVPMRSLDFYAGSSPDEAIGFLIYLILPAALWPWGRLSL
jgi:hypothetical protein